MGIIWRFAMPLLSTLAALVIIVHTADEDTETEYRRGLRPRVLDTGTPRYDQPWRDIEAEQAVHDYHTTQSSNWDDNSSEEPPKRRRPGRKRKRRPQLSSAEEPASNERYVYPEEPHRPFFEVDYGRNRQSTEIPIKRRKNLQTIPKRWTDEPLEADRPLRRRGLRRKRPSLDTWPALSEFGGYRPDHTETEINTQKSNEQSDPMRLDNHFAQIEFIENDFTAQEIRITTTNSPKPSLYDLIDNGDLQLAKEYMKEDKSLSEFSFELMSPIGEDSTTDDDKDKLLEKGTEQNIEVVPSIEETQDAGPIDPVTLREILKSSNGTSLSEILQQHNLSLGDLLHGKRNALTVLKSKDSFKIKPQAPSENKPKFEVNNSEIEADQEKLIINSETKYVTEPITEYSVTTKDYQELENQTTSNINDDIKPLTVVEMPVTREILNRSLPRIVTKRRFPGGIRRKQRMRPLLNNTINAQVNSKLKALNARRYNNRRNSTKNMEEVKDIITTMKSINITEDFTIKEENETVKMASIHEDTKTLHVLEKDSKVQNKNTSDIENISMDVTEVTTMTTKNIDDDIEIKEKSAETSITRPVNASTIRRQAFNNRLKKKRLKQKNSTTEPPQDDLLKSLYGMGNLVSSSEFIARTQTQKSVPEDHLESETTLEDFILTTELPKKQNRSRTTRPTVTFSITSELPEIIITTEETAKIEIEEILNDTQTSAKLSQILMERNMTLSELVQHRERGSSHVHLADIFHNASKEPNPPEPFLSKSLIEPISREIYPLRALLDANLHDPTGKATTIDPNFVKKNLVNIPVVMDFGNNVNENAENMGIMSLFHNFTKNEVNNGEGNNTLKQESEDRTNKISITKVNITRTSDTSDTARDSRISEESKDDVVSWNEIFTLMRRNHRNETEGLAQTITKKLLPTRSSKKITLEDDIDGDGLIVLEDLQHLKEFDNNIASPSNEKLEVKPYKNNNIQQPTQIPGILEKIPSNTKSVTVATASIAGLAMVLFLLTYAGFKWKQQQTINRKKRSFGDERIPTPVFENRKGHKNNSSTRSISPMLSTSNIYTLNTLDSHNGKESPDYMWDTLRKPFQ